MQGLADVFEGVGWQADRLMQGLADVLWDLWMA